jgi:hypothetical protein
MNTLNATTDSSAFYQLLRNFLDAFPQLAFLRLYDSCFFLPIDHHIDSAYFHHGRFFGRNPWAAEIFIYRSVSLANPSEIENEKAKRDLEGNSGR